jgi:hypothetical protein
LKEFQRLITSLEPTGDVIWQLDPSKALDINVSYDPSIGRGHLSRNTFAGCPALMVYNISEIVRLSKYMPLGIGSRIGFEGSFGVHYDNRNPTYIEVHILRYRNYPTAKAEQACVRIFHPMPSGNYLKVIKDTDGITFGGTGGTNFATDGEDTDVAHSDGAYGGFTWNHFKLVADFNAGKYVRFTYKGKTYDLSSYSMPSDAVSLYASDCFEFAVSPYGGLNSLFFVKDLIITVDEP